MPSEAIRYENNLATVRYPGNVDSMALTCSSCKAEYHIHYSNSESARLADCRYLAEKRINAEHPEHERTILL